MLVTKRNGLTEDFDADKINKNVERACEGLDDVSPSEVVLDAQIKLYEGVHTKEIDEALIISARSKIEKEPKYAYVAARLLLFTIQKEVFGKSISSDDNVDFLYRVTFKENLGELIREGIINPDMAIKFNLDYLSSKMVPARDDLFKYLGLQSIYDRYLLKDKQGRRLETPQAFFMRVAMGLALNEDNPDLRAVQFYEVLSNFDLMCSTPTLFNSGTVRSQLSSCYLNTFDDSIDGIFDGLWQEARKSKYAGGLGFDITPFRGRGSFINGTNGENQGAVYFWKLYNDMLIAVNQGGKRRGAGCAYMETWHSDIEDFLSLRKNTGDERTRTHDMNTANWIPDLFMKQVKEDGSWYLFSPDEVPELHELFGDAFETAYWERVEQGKRGEMRIFREVKAKDLWKKMLRSLFETGHPWITFKDACNERYSNQHVGTVHSSNLCTEIMLHTKPSKYDRGVKTEIGETAVCNLASVNLVNHLLDNPKDGIDTDKLQHTVKTAIRMLDNVIDLNFYPTEEARKSNMTHRPIGLGSMGWQDIYYEMDISYESIDAVRMADAIYENISYYAILASSELAKERGSYSTFDGSLWSKGILPIDTYLKRHMKMSDDHKSIAYRKPWNHLREKIKEQGMRNSNTMAIAPTASIGFITGVVQSVEPNFNVLYVYSTLSGEFIMINEHFVKEMKELGLWSQQMAEVVKYVDGDLTQVDDELIPPHIKEKYKPAFKVNQLALIDCAAARQKWIDQGQSLNLYNEGTSLKALNDMYFHAWDKGLKTTYYLRNAPASRVEKSTVDSSVMEKITQLNQQKNDRRPDNEVECEGCQ